jgi:hypothetical protein
VGALDSTTCLPRNHQYGLQAQLKRATGTASPNGATRGPEWIYFPNNGKLEKMRNEEYERRIISAMTTSFNIDGEGGRIVFEYPYNPHVDTRRQKRWGTSLSRIPWPRLRGKSVMMILL